jgi:hypothetical protein
MLNSLKYLMRKLDFFIKNVSLHSEFQTFRQWPTKQYSICLMRMSVEEGESGGGPQQRWRQSARIRRRSARRWSARRRWCRRAVGEALDGWGGVEANAAGEVWGGMEADAVVDRWCVEAVDEATAVQAWRHAGGGEMIVARIRVRAPHT